MRQTMQGKKEEDLRQVFNKVCEVGIDEEYSKGEVTATSAFLAACDIK